VLLHSRLLFHFWADACAFAVPPRVFQGAPLVDELSADELSAAVAAERRRLARRVAHALATLAGASPVASERAEFACLLRKEVDRYEDLLESGDAARVLSAHGPSRLSARLSSLLSGLERELDRVDASIGQKLHRLDLNADGRLDRAELAGVAGGLLRDALQGEDLRAVLGDAVFDADGNIKLADLIALAQEAQEDGGDEPAPTVRPCTWVCATDSVDALSADESRAPRVPLRRWRRRRLRRRCSPPSRRAAHPGRERLTVLARRPWRRCCPRTRACCCKAHAGVERTMQTRTSARRRCFVPARVLCCVSGIWMSVRARGFVTGTPWMREPPFLCHVIRKGFTSAGTK
jgi:hypothetical protein